LRIASCGGNGVKAIGIIAVLRLELLGIAGGAIDKPERSQHGIGPVRFAIFGAWPQGRADVRVAVGKQGEEKD
jgi:hypothetical protein